MPAGVVEAVRSAVRDALAAVGAPPGAVLLAAVSGGQDSVCLFDALGAVLPTLGGEVVLGHVEHGIRGADSVRDASFVRDLAEEQGRRSAGLRVDVPSYAAHHRLSLEEAARALRYRALAAMARQHGAWAVATGHTTDDLVETLLINIVRGTGLAGERGIAKDQQLDLLALGPPAAGRAEAACVSPVVRVVRPLLALTRGMTEAYCRTRGLEFRVDPTNADPTFLRNRVRHHLLPLLRTYNPSIVGGLANLAAIVADDDAALERLADQEWSARATVAPGAVTVGWDRWDTLPTALQRRLLRRAGRELGIAGGWSFDAVESARLLLSRRQAGRRLALKGGVQLTTSRSGFRLVSADALGDGDRSG